MDLHYIIVLCVCALAHAQGPGPDVECFNALQTCFSHVEFGQVQLLMSGDDIPDEQYRASCSVLTSKRPCLKSQHSGPCSGDNNNGFMNNLIYMYPIRCKATPTEHDAIDKCRMGSSAFSTCDPDGALSAMMSVGQPLNCQTITSRVNCLTSTLRIDCGGGAANITRLTYLVTIWLKHGGTLHCEIFNEVTEEHSSEGVAAPAVIAAADDEAAVDHDVTEPVVDDAGEHVAAEQPTDAPGAATTSLLSVCTVMGTFMAFLLSIN